MIDFAPSGDIQPPPSKSYGHRALICAALAASGPAKGESVILGAGLSEDIEATRAALPVFGAEAEPSGDMIFVRPSARSEQRAVDCGESGSTLRFLLPLAAVLNRGRRVVFTGRGRLLERPLDAYAEIFAEAGVRFQRSPAEISVEGTLPGGDYRLPGDVSSQFISGLLLALPLADADSSIKLTTPLESAPYVDMTLETMAAFGLEIERPDVSRFLIRGRRHYRPSAFALEADYSQAAFFLAAGALGRPVRCLGLTRDSLQGDRAIVGILERMGAEVVWSGGAALARSTGRLKAATIDVREIPDLTPVLAALAALAEGTSRIVNAGRLRLKESDRLRSMFLELRKMGADIHEEPEGLTINGRAALEGGVTVEAHNDHRVAMALAAAALGCRKPIAVNGFDCVNKSYPNFWDDFGRPR